MSNKNVVLVFSSTWCNPCKSAKQYLKMQYGEDSTLYSIVDVTENEETAYHYGIRNIPTFILLDADGKEVRRFTGFDKEKVDNILSEVV